MLRAFALFVPPLSQLLTTDKHSVFDSLVPLRLPSGATIRPQRRIQSPQHPNSALIDESEIEAAFDQVVPLSSDPSSMIRLFSLFKSFYVSI